MPAQTTTPVAIDPASLPGHIAYFAPAMQGWTDGQSLTGLTLVNQDAPGTRDLTITGSGAYYRASAVNGQGAIAFEASPAKAAADSWMPSDLQVASSVVVHKVPPGVNAYWDGTGSFWVFNPSAVPGTVAIHGRAATDVKAGPGVRGDGWHLYTEAVNNGSGSSWAGRRGVVAAIDAACIRENSAGWTVVGRKLEIPRSGLYSMARWHLFNRVLTWPERFGIGVWAAQTYGTYSPFMSPTAHPLIVTIGNSTTVGWPRYMESHASITPTGAWAVNLAVSAGQYTAIDQQLPEMTEIVTAARTAGMPVLLVAHVGHNDAFGATVINSLKSATFQSLRALGAKLLVTTPSCWNANPFNEAGRVVYNGWLRGEGGYVGTYGDPSTYIDVISDVLGRDYDDAPTNTIVSKFGKYTDSKATYPALWSDDVHATSPAGTTAVLDILAPAIGAAVASAIAGLIDPKTISVGSTTPTSITLTCPAASGSKAPYTYIWTRDGSTLAGATGANLTDSTGLAPGTSYSYVRRSTDASGFYRDSPAASASTAAAGPSLAATASAVATSPTAASLVCSPSGGTGPYTYQWRDGGSPIAGATSATRAVTGLTPGATHTYSCVVTDAAAATVTATADALTQPAALAVVVTIGTIGATTIDATAAATGGIAPRTIQWTLGVWDVAGKTGASATLDGLDPETIYAVGCRVTDSSTPPETAADSEDATTLAASTPIQLDSITVTARTGTTITVTAATSNGAGAKSWQWYANGAFFDLLNAATVTFTGLTPDTSYSIKGVVTDTSGSDERIISASTLAEAPTGDAAAIAAAVWNLADGIEPGESPRQTMRLLRAVLAGKSTGGAVPTFQRADGTTTALTVTLDGSGGRTSSTPGEV